MTYDLTIAVYGNAVNKVLISSALILLQCCSSWKHCLQCHEKKNACTALTASDLHTLLSVRIFLPDRTENSRLPAKQ